MNMQRTPAGVLIPLILSAFPSHASNSKIGILNSNLSKNKRTEVSLDSKILFTVRTHTVEHHKGQISFPGGVFEAENDVTLLDTALRETDEEMGISPSLIEVAADLPEIPTASSSFLIKPYLGLIRTFPTLKINPHEIDEVLEVTLMHLINPVNQKEEYFERGTHRILMKSYFYKDFRIWGATALILQTFLEKYLTIQE